MKDVNKQFSRIGMTLFIGVALSMLATQFVSRIMTTLFPAVYENRDLFFLTTQIPMYLVFYPLMFLLFQSIPQQKSDTSVKKMSLSHLLGAFLICEAGVYPINVLTTLLTTTIGTLRQRPVENVVLNVVGDLNPLLNLLVIVLIAPIAEELLYRKMIIDRISCYGEGMAVVFSGLVFALFHGNLSQFTYTFFLGICLAYVYVKTQNLLYPVVIHIVFNFWGGFLSTWVLKKSGIWELLEALPLGLTEQELIEQIETNVTGFLLYGAYYFVFIVMVLAGIIIFFINRKKITFEPGQIVIEKGKRFKTMILNPGVMIYTVICVLILLWHL